MNTKNLFNALAAVLVLATKATAAFDLGTPSSSTPYEPYMQPVKKVLGGLGGQKATMGQVKDYMKTSFSFRYKFTEPYVAATPEVTSKTKTGDCKAKSLWLVNQMGDKNVRYVIGKARSTSKISHAWVMWNDGGKWWILDPTNTSRPIAAENTGKNEYIPLYSYQPGQAFRHNSMIAAQQAGKGVAVAAEKAGR